MRRMMTRRMRRVLLSLLATMTLISGPARADVKLPAIFGDHMVLQQRAETPIWGWANPGERVRVWGSWDEDAAAEVVADERGSWLARVATPAAGGPHRLTVSGLTTVVLDDVLVGEVWLCSGQSNMEWRVRQAADPQNEIAAGDHPEIRLFTVRNTLAAVPRLDVRGAWHPCSPETVADFSATGYFFGRSVHETLDVPIGLISADWGGTIVEAWTSAEALWKFPESRPALERLEEIVDPDRREREVKQRVADWWANLDAGIGDEWLASRVVADGWREVDIPSSWSTHGLGDFDGVACFRRTVDLPNDWAGRRATLELGPIDDYDDVWINGTHIGATHAAGQWNTPRRYDIPADVLRDGRNVLAVRVLDTGGIGGINGRPEQLRLEWGGRSVSLAGPWRYRAGRSMRELPSRPEGVSVSPNTPSVLYNGMIAPLVPYRLAGVIWYQGESNRRNAVRYRSLFPAMITDWRRRWDQGTFPFLYVQIAPFAYGGDRGETALLREAQLMALDVPNTGMVVTSDIGNPRDIHPKNKQEVGRRLALWALAEIYGHHDVVPSGPIYRTDEIDGDSIRIRFDYAGDGLVLRESDRSHFLIAGEDRQFVAADAVIDGADVIVSSPQVRRPMAVRYGWDAASEPNLANRAGLPASPFRTDDWD